MDADPPFYGAIVVWVAGVGLRQEVTLSCLEACCTLYGEDSRSDRIRGCCAGELIPW